MMAKSRTRTKAAQRPTLAQKLSQAKEAGRAEGFDALGDVMQLLEALRAAVEELQRLGN